MISNLSFAIARLIILLANITIFCSFIRFYEQKTPYSSSSKQSVRYNSVKPTRLSNPPFFTDYPCGLDDFSPKNSSSYTEGRSRFTKRWQSDRVLYQSIGIPVQKIPARHEVVLQLPFRLPASRSGDVAAAPGNLFAFGERIGVFLL